MVWAYHLKELLLSFQKIRKSLNLNHQNSSYRPTQYCSHTHNRYSVLILVLAASLGPLLSSPLSFRSHLTLTHDTLLATVFKGNLPTHSLWSKHTIPTLVLLNRNHISETLADFPVILVHRDMHLLNSVLKSYSMPQFLLCSYCCLANTTAFIV